MTNNIQKKGQGLTEIFCKLVKQQSVPDVDLNVFDGNPLEYHYFMTLFHKIVERRLDDHKRKLAHLIKYTTGDAKEIIKHCVHQLPALGFNNAKALLERKYGNT